MSFIRWEEDPVPLGKRARTIVQRALRELSTRVGLLKNLSDTVEDKTDVVHAVSGVSNRVGNLVDLNTNSKTTIVSAINSIWTHVKETMEKWLGKSTEVDEKYIAAHGNTVSKLVNYLLGRDETVASKESVGALAETVSDVRTAANNASELATNANSVALGAQEKADSAKKTADNASNWLGSKSDVSAATLTHGNNVSKLIEYLAQSGGGSANIARVAWNTQTTPQEMPYNVPANDVQSLTIPFSRTHEANTKYHIIGVEFVGDDFPMPNDISVDYFGGNIIRLRNHTGNAKSGTLYPMFTVWIES